VRLWRLAKCEIAFLVATLRGSRCCFLPSVRLWSESFSWRALWNCRRNFHPFSQRKTQIRVSLGWKFLRSSTEIPKHDQKVLEFCTPSANLAMNVTLSEINDPTSSTSSALRTIEQTAGDLLNATSCRIHVHNVANGKVWHIADGNKRVELHATKVIIWSSFTAQIVADGAVGPSMPGHRPFLARGLGLPASRSGHRPFLACRRVISFRFLTIDSVFNIVSFSDD